MNQKSFAFSDLIEMAIADGVLSASEEEIIRRIAREKGADDNHLISTLKENLSKSSIPPETEIIDYNRKNGEDFEKFIVAKFNRKYFTLKEWSGDKYINGIYAESTPHPDLHLIFRLDGKQCEFSVECKWRRRFQKNWLFIANPDQLIRYRKFENENRFPVFMAIGVGGTGSAPEELFILPLKRIRTSFYHKYRIRVFKKDTDSAFYYHPEEQRLT